MKKQRYSIAIQPYPFHFTGIDLKKNFNPALISLDNFMKKNLRYVNAWRL